MHQLLQLWFNWVHDWGYLGVLVLMAMESSIFPVPSEVVVPPAAYWASQGKMTLLCPGVPLPPAIANNPDINFSGVVFAGTLGSWIGAAITYWVSLWVGRLLIVKWGRYFFISEAKLQRAEHWVHRYEAGGIFFARLLPVVRHLISIPAGIIRMNFKVFSVMTIAGSLIWCWVLALWGERVLGQHPKLIEDPAEMVHFMKDQSIWLVAFVLVLCGLYVLVMKLTGPQTARRS
jgi:membrane protein DedA with SNARE-associated domain